jgi:hypothetical protein
MRIQTRLVLPVLLFAAFISGCSDPCSIPLERSPRLRILNAMADQHQVNLFLNGKLVQEGLVYDPAVTYRPPVDPTYVGYITQFADSTLLPIGSGQNLVITSMNGDTLLKKTISLSDGRQSMILIGRARQRLGRPLAPPDILMLDDESATPIDGQTVARYVHAMPDLDSLDVYFSRTISGTPLRIKYGQVTDYRLVQNADGLTVTEAGDTSNVIIRIEQPFELKGLLGTVVIRGSTDAQGDEPIAAPVVLADGGLGAAIFDITSIYVRFVNGGRDIPLSLQPKGTIDKGPRNDIAGQEKVFCIEPGASSEYWSITPFFHGTAKWHFGNMCPRIDSNFAYSFDQTLEKLKRYTIAAMLTSKLGQPDVWSHMTILDTLNSPVGTTHGRIRFVNLSPDATVTILTPSGNRSLQQGETLYMDYPVGQPITAGGKTLSVTAVADDPQTVWFTAATSTDPQPYNVSED